MKSQSSSDCESSSEEESFEFSKESSENDERQVKKSYNSYSVNSAKSLDKVGTQYLQISPMMKHCNGKDYTSTVASMRAMTKHQKAKENDHGIIINMEAAEGPQYADKTLDMDNVRTAGGHPRTGIAWLDKHLEGLETWQIEEVLTISQLKPGICVAAAGALNPKNLRTKNINLIVNVTKEIEPYSSPETMNGNITVVKIPVFDVPDTNLAKFMKPVARLVYTNKLAGGNTVIHCVLGVSRSVTLCCAYMLFYYTIGLQRILTLIQAKRPIINPNGGFKGQLKAFEEYIKKYGRDNLITD